ncbi:hypothetical protein N9917_01100 [Deltaproteobacteria bacterium]|nr:hypothetical protein [Deltaproteobacteria bacterium]
MKKSITQVRRVVMAKDVAASWLEKRAKAEYRLTVYYGAREVRNLPGLVRSLRDNRLKMAGVSPLPDLGIAEAFDSFTVWSQDRVALITLKDWFEKRDIETSGVW